MAGEQINVTKPTLPPLQEYLAELADVWHNHWLTNAGPKHQALEAALREYLGAEHLALFANGHLALEAALQVLGITGEVITTPFTFASTAQAIAHSGATPRFADVDPVTLCLDPAAIEAAITPQTEAILPVHVYGNVCDTQAIAAIAARHHLPVIYDAAHAFGVQPPVGAMGDISMFSFHATKVFHTIEGGALAFHDPALADQFKAWRAFGQLGKEDAEMVGTNAKLTEFAAAMGLVNLRHVDEWIAKRRALAALYVDGLRGLDGVELLPTAPGSSPNYYCFPVFFDPAVRSRDVVADELAAQGVNARKYFYPLVSRFSAWADQPFAQAHTPVAEQAAARVLCLPLYPDLAAAEVERIISIVKGALE
ncbi:MAG: DegT/DnrJ/EryC1/StrS family aminotransferase [Propionibacteriaceae bacterium]|jgi:dTDP-4-amino-4,6-dideoxygalactose transaminase|nr:DegT/DnrJ/EryC1/StrS family aminotransferase [Propionibacteriaceae bacterium]